MTHMSSSISYTRRSFRVNLAESISSLHMGKVLQSLHNLAMINLLCYSGSIFPGALISKACFDLGVALRIKFAKLTENLMCCLFVHYILFVFIIFSS